MAAGYGAIFKRKVEIKNVILGLINDLKSKYGIQVNYAQCDNAEENENFEMACKQKGMGIEFNYTGLTTP